MPTTEIKGFQVLPLRLPDSSGTLYIYFRKHEMKGAAGAQSISGRSLFVFNLPIQTNYLVIKKYFQQVAIGATVESFIPSILTDLQEDFYVDLTKLTSDLHYEEDSNGYKEIARKLPKNCGIITFIDKAAFQLAFNALKKLSNDAKVTNWPVPTLGSAFLQEKYQKQILDPAQLSAAVATALANFNRAEQELMEDLKRSTQVVDEDGFTLVVGSHRKTKAGIMGKQKLAATVGLEKAKSKLKKKEKEDFYRFQLREKKKAEMNDLLQKFKQDQERVKAMKEKKRFRPY
uniref:Ribosomal RNA-processing protein 7 C-terminal domain-containing protein n=1 Tax=Candidozyma auris TaxID=498019 RepID=A0A0L0NV01_CANAR